MGEILGNPGILGQGGVSSSPHPKMLLGWERYLGITGYLDKGGYLVLPILGCSGDGRDTWESGDTWTRGVSSSPHPRMLLERGRYLGMFQEWGGYVLKGEVATSLRPSGNGLGSEWHSVYPILVGNSGVHGHVSASLDNPPTLHDHVSGKIALGAKSGPDPYLSFEKEEELASFLVQTAEIGYPHTKRQVLALVQQIINKKGIDANVSNGWWERFCQRHPSITLRAAVPFSLARAVASDSEVVNKYFDLLEECLQQNEILNKPGLIFNCDETGLPLNPTWLKVVDKVGSKNPSIVTSGDKSQLTSAAGYTIPPFVIFDRKALNPKLTEGEVSGTLYSLSHNDG